MHFVGFGLGAQSFRFTARREIPGIKINDFRFNGGTQEDDVTKTYSGKYCCLPTKIIINNQKSYRLSLL